MLDAVLQRSHGKKFDKTPREFPRVFRTAGRERVALKAPMLNVFLYAPQSFHNLCLMARTLEAFGHRECSIFDPHQIVRDRYGKMRSREMRAVSAGAFEKIRWLRQDDPGRFLSDYDGRVVTTVLAPGAIPLTEHEFASTDLLVFGSETRGLPDEVVALGDVGLTIPLVGETQSLNLAVALGIVLFEGQRQLRLLPR
jgi:tRNA G18 (ribose-2'-O)-methylase SpoU